MGTIRIRNAGEERESIPMVSKTVLERVVENKDKQYKEMRSHYEEKLEHKKSEVAIHLHNEKNYERIIKEKDRLIYIVGGASAAIGGLIGWLIH